MIINSMENILELECAVGSFWTEFLPSISFRMQG